MLMPAVEYTLGDAVRDARLVSDLTQQQLGQVVGVSAQMVSDVERGRRCPSPEVMGRLAAALSLDRVRLFVLAESLPPELWAYLRKEPLAAQLLALLAQAEPIEATYDVMMDVLEAQVGR